MLCSEATNVELLSPCTHEEADTRMLLHAADGVKQGKQTIVIRTVDTDVIELAVSFVRRLGCESLVVAIGTEKSFRYVDATTIAHVLGVDKCKTLPVFHALTGCDTTSCFAGRGKRTAWASRNIFSSVTPALCALVDTPSAAVLREVLRTIERSVVVLYNRGRSEDDVNRARQVHSTQKGIYIETVPPTQDALVQHLLRVGYQAGHVWGQVLLKAPHLPNPADFDWTRKGDVPEWEVQWTTLPPAGTTCRAIIKCSCTKGCRGQCRCLKANLRCTMLYKCDGCQRDV